jgi:hypothetical protein
MTYFNGSYSNSVSCSRICTNMNDTNLCTYIGCLLFTVVDSCYCYCVFQVSLSTDTEGATHFKTVQSRAWVYPASLMRVYSARGNQSASPYNSQEFDWIWFDWIWFNDPSTVILSFRAAPRRVWHLTRVVPYVMVADILIWKTGKFDKLISEHSLANTSFQTRDYKVYSKLYVIPENSIQDMCPLDGILVYQR